LLFESVCGSNALFLYPFETQNTEQSQPLNNPEVPVNSTIGSGNMPIIEVPGGIVFISWFYLILGILGILGLLFISFFLNILTSLSTVFLVFLFPSILLDISFIIFSFFIWYGFRHLRKSSLIIYKIIGGLAILLGVYALIRSGNSLSYLIGIVISVVMYGYVWSKSATFISKQEADSLNIRFKATLPLWGKVLFGIYIIVLLAPISFIIFLYTAPKVDDHVKPIESSIVSPTPGSSIDTTIYLDSKNSVSFHYPKNLMSQELDLEKLSLNNASQSAALQASKTLLQVNFLAENNQSEIIYLVKDFSSLESYKQYVTSLNTGQNAKNVDYFQIATFLNKDKTFTKIVIDLKQNGSITHSVAYAFLTKTKKVAEVVFDNHDRIEVQNGEKLVLDTISF
jgi:hypothetical protein